MRQIIPALAICFTTTGLTPSYAQTAIGTASDIVQVDLLEGWREADGRHIAAVRLRLADGWKTYWRAPGDGGLPTTLQWSHSDNLENLRILWPRPNVYDDGGMRSLGYMGEVVLPIELTPDRSGDILFSARLNFGVCREVCVPAVVDLKQVLQSSVTRDVTQIHSALVEAPIPAEQASVRGVSCTIEPTTKGHTVVVDVTADLHGQTRAMVVELNDPDVWVSRTELTSNDRHWHGVTHIFDHRESQPAVSANDLRITLLTDKAAVDIQGCVLP